MGDSKDHPLHVLLRTPVGMNGALASKVAARLEDVVGRPVTVEERVDRRLHGAVISLGGAHEIEIGLEDALKTLDSSMQELRRRIDSGEPPPSADEVIAAIEGLDVGKGFAVRETNLRKLLMTYEGNSLKVQLQSSVDEQTIQRLQQKLSAAAGRELALEVEIVPRLESRAVLLLGADRRIELDLPSRYLSGLRTKVLEGRDELLMAPPEDIGAHLSRMIEETEPQLEVEEVVEIGTVVSVGDGTAMVTGLSNVGSQEIVQFQNEVYGMAFTLSRNIVGCILLGPEERIQEGSPVLRTGRGLHVPVGELLVGRIVNALGQPIDGKGPIASHAYRLVERKAPGVVRRRPVKEPLHTGIKALDALVPLGRGQRELIIGDRKIGKTTIALDTILAQRDSDVICIYVAIGQKASSIARVVQVLQQADAMEYTIIVAALSNEQPSFRYLAPYAGCAIGEELMEDGKHALIIYDDLSKHAVTYREMSALLKRPIGREAYPGDIFYIHSRLLERAAKMRDDLGGGSLTALPIVETLAGDISAFIPTNVISICDGQIFLDGSQFNEGFRPAIDAGLSVSRVGGAAQTKAMKKVAGRLRIDMAQYQEMATFVKFGAEVDKATLAQLTRGERGRQLLIQDQHKPMSMEEETIILYAVTRGYLDDVALELAGSFEEQFLDFVKERYGLIIEQLAETKDLSPALEKQMAVALESFRRGFLKEHPPAEEFQSLVL